jgi:macrolide transport system ATP-binding/permease protein
MAATFIRGLFYGMRPSDLPTLTIVVEVLILATLLASYIPACRAAWLNPVETLRSE